MKHFLYQVNNKVNGKFYRGVHSTENMDDGYMGSGVAIKSAIKQHGPDCFERVILCYCNSREEAFQLEELAVTEEDVNNPQCYNLHVGGDQPPIMVGANNPNFGKPRQKWIRDKIRQTKAGKSFGGVTTHSDDTKKKMSDAHVGKKISAEHLKNMSLSRLGQKAWNKGKKTGMPSPRRKELTPTTILEVQSHPSWDRRAPISVSQWLKKNKGIIHGPGVIARVQALWQ